MYYWTIMIDIGGKAKEVAHGLQGYETKERALEASRLERQAHRWFMADGYWDRVAFVPVAD